MSFNEFFIVILIIRLLFLRNFEVFEKFLIS